MILKLLKMGNISWDVIPHHINLSAVTVEDYRLVYDIIQKVKEEEFAVLHLNACQIEDELNKVSRPCVSSQKIIS
jgi:solute carrier family 6 amino acid/orphan transporter-like 15/16/17/18/20